MALSNRFTGGVPRGIFVIPWRYMDWGAFTEFLQQRNVNTISLSIKDSQGFVFFPSEVAPSVPLSERKLEEGIRTLHDSGMRVTASLATFADTAVAQRRSEWLALARDGRRARPLEAWSDWSEAFYYHLCPTRPEYRDYFLRLVDEIVTRYEVDGIDLDFIRYPFGPAVGESEPIHFCYCDHCTTQFQQDHGLDAKKLTSGDEGWQVWIEWRAEQISQFVQDVKERIQKRSGLTLMTYIATYGSRSHDRRELQVIREKYGQDTVALGRVVDILAPMLYHVFTEEPVHYTRQGPFWIKVMTRWLAELAREVWPVVQGADPATAEELQSAIENAFNGGASGILIYPGRSWQMNEAKWSKAGAVYSVLAQVPKELC